MSSGKKLIALVVLLLSFIFIQGWSIYYNDPFTGSSVDWQYDFRYSRSMGTYWPTGGDGNTVSVTGGVLEYTGQVVNAFYGTEIYGIVSKFETTYDASPEQPFGYEITRLASWVDPHDDSSNPESGRMKANFIMYLAQDNMSDGIHYDDFISIVEFMRPQLGPNDGETSEADVLPLSFWATSEGGSREASFDFDLATTPDGSGTAPGQLSNIMEWPYDDNWGSGDYTRNANARYQNDNDIRLRLTTDGEYAYFYVNPAPEGNPTATRTLMDGSTYDFTNTYYLVSTLPISFTNDIIPMFGFGNNRTDAEEQSGQFDDFMIRSVCDTLTSEVSPAYAKAGATIPLKIVVQPQFSSSDEAGVSEVYIDMPVGYSWTNNTNSLYVSWVTNNALHTSFTVNAGTDNPDTGNVNISLEDSGQRLKVRFDAAGADDNVFHPDNISADNPAIEFVISNFVTKAGADSIGKECTIYVNNEKYGDTDWAKTATTGKMRSETGNVYDFGSEDGNSLVLRTVNDPEGLGAIRPGFIYEGDTSKFYYDISALNSDNNADITKLQIKVPDGFSIDPTKFGSDRITDTAYIYLTNISSQQYIIADYEGFGTMIRAGSGIDTVSFYNISTTNFDDTNEVIVGWESYAYSWVDGTSVVTNDTNSLYLSQEVLVRKKPPSGEVTINSLFDDTFLGDDKKYFVRNTFVSNNYSCFVRNTGIAGNKIRQLLIEVDPVITNIYDIVSSINADVTLIYTNDTYHPNVTNFSEDHYIMLIDFDAQSTNIANGLSNTVTFTGLDDVHSLTNEIVTIDFPVYADNGNGDEWVLLSEKTWDISFYTPPAVAKAKINSPNAEQGEYTNAYNHYLHTDLESSTNIQILIKNWGESDNHIAFARIICPPEISTVSGYNSAKGALITNIKENGTNTVYIEYTNVGLLQADDSIPANGQQDTITLMVSDNVIAPETVYFEVIADNSSNYNMVASALEDAANLSLTFIYAPPKADAYVDVPLGYIPAESDDTNVVYYHLFNNGRAENYIRIAKIVFDDTYISNVVFLSNDLPISTSNYNSGNGEFTINYSGNSFPGGSEDMIAFGLLDSVSAGTIHFDVITSVSNDRWLTNNVSVTSGFGNSIDIIPPPTRYAYSISPTVLHNAKAATDTNELVISISNRGVGSNLLDKVRVEIPAQFLGKVLEVSNELMELTNTAGGNVEISGSYITVDYNSEGTNLTAGGLDKLHVWVEMDTETAFHSTWDVMAHNNSTNELTNGGWMLAIDDKLATNLVSVVNPPYAYMDPNEVLTPSENNYFDFILKNGDGTTGRGIDKIMIGFPSYFTAVSYLSGWGSPSTSTSNSGLTNYLIVDGNSLLSAGSSVVLVANGTDSWTSGTTNLNFDLQVDYGDGAGWYDAGVWDSKSLNLNFVNPTAIGLTYVTPNNVPQDYPTNSYEFYIKNNGEADNDIRVVKIEAPGFITNITDINVVSGDATNWVSNNNAVYLFYTNALASTIADTITMVGWDNIDSPDTTNDVWSISVDNTTNMSSFNVATVAGGKSRELNIIKPAYSSTVHIEATNSVSIFDKTSIYSVYETNYLKFYVYNQSGTGNNITAAKIAIPGIGVLDTNSMTIDLLVKSGASSAISNGYIWIDYSADQILPAQHDEVLITTTDSIEHTETNFTWSAETAFDTTFGLLKSANQYPGKSLTMNYVMPEPNAVIVIEPGEVYLNKSSFALHYSISNAGVGTSDLDEVTITLPSMLQTGFSVSSVSNSIASSTNYSGGVLTLGYTGSTFSPGTVEDLYLYVNNSASASTTENILSEVRNYINTDSAVGDTNIFVTSIPTYYVTPNEIDTTTSQNDFEIYINNDYNGSEAIQRIILELPGEFDSIISKDSLIIDDDAANIMGMISSLTLDYAADSKSIQVGDGDILSLTLSDDYEIGNLTNNIAAYVDSGTGFVPMQLKGGRSSNVIFVMPPTVSENISDPYPLNVYLGEINNSMSISITNMATGSGKISFARIWLPEDFESVSGIVSSNEAVVTFVADSNLIELEYTNLFDILTEDSISFDFINGFDRVTNAYIHVETANLTNNPVYYTAPGQLGDYTIVNVGYPPFAAEGYFYGDNRLYLVETNAVLTYRILNRSYSTIITQATITFDTNLNDVFDSIEMASSEAISNTYNGVNEWVLYYDENDDDPVSYSLYDDVNFNINYSLNTNLLINVDSSAVVMNTIDFSTTNLDCIAVGGNYSYIETTNSTWGILTGDIFPGLFSVTYKIYLPDTVTAATNETGDALGGSSTAGTGKYSLSRIPAGTYDIAVQESDFFRAMRTNFSIEADAITTLTTLTMRNAPLDAGDESGVQTNYCWEDTNSFMIFPEGAIDSGDSFSVDISTRLFTEPEKSGVSAASELIPAPSDDSGLYGYIFDLNSFIDESMEGSLLELDATLQLAYDQTFIESLGWSEDSLAVYYWDDNGLTGQWVRVGGETDTDTDVIVAKVAYVHTFYAIMGKAAYTAEGNIQNVTLRPKVFTPGVDADYFENIRLTFELKDPAPYTVKIYNLAGNLIREYDHTDGDYSQGEISWDGEDGDGYPVTSGVYVYRVEAGTEVYSGTVIIAR